VSFEDNIIILIKKPVEIKLNDDDNVTDFLIEDS